MRLTTAIIVLLLFSAPLSAVVSGSADEETVASGRSSGIDVSVDSVAISYTSSTNESKYRMFSSNYPIFGFNRPAQLYTIDTVVGVPVNVQISVSNSGTVDTGSFDLRVKVLHNEYQRFEMFNSTVQILNVGAGSSTTASIDVVVNYSGNHTLAIYPEYQWIDDNLNNDDFQRHFTVAYSYSNCDDFTGWTVGPEWSLNSDTSISAGRSCHVGNGEFSTYSPSQVTSLETPVFDLSDAHPNPTNTVGLGFFYTGSAGSGDTFRTYALDKTGNWDSLLTIQNTIDGSFQDGANWQTFSANANGHTSPVVPMDFSEHFHQNSKLKFELTADANDEDIGYWFDEFVLIYDQVARETEYAFESRGIQTTGSLPDEWGKVSIEVSNTGNISDRLLPILNGIDEDWQYYFAHSTGATIPQNAGFTIMPGESRQIDLFLRPDVNETIGFKQMDLVFQSASNSAVNSTLPISYQVQPDRIPSVIVPSQRPSCAPGQSCNFQIDVENIGQATDVFELSVDGASLSDGWSVQLSWNQPSAILARPNMPVTIDLQMTVPAEAIPDSTSSFDMIVTSQNNSEKFANQEITISASLTSDAGFELIETGQDWSVFAGESITLNYKLFNNASRQDIFDIDIISSGGMNWEIVEEQRPSLFINSQGYSTLSVTIIAPTNAQAGDHGPSITIRATSQRSGMTFESIEFTDLRVGNVEDLSLRILTGAERIKPGEATMMFFEVENNGNGESVALVEIQDVSESWSWWIRINDQNHSGGIDLTASYDLGDIIQFELWIILPMTEASGEIHDLIVTVTPESGITDANISDNSVEVSFITSSVKKPILLIDDYPSSVFLGSSYSINGSITNSGNAPDNSVTLRPTLSSSPEALGLTGFITLNGVSYPVNGDEIQISMNIAESINFTIDVIVPENAQLNTRIVVQITARGGVNSDGFPYEIDRDVLTIADQRRSIDFSIENLELESIRDGGTGAFWINLTSMSSLQENLALTITTGDGWESGCGVDIDNSSNSYNYNFTIPDSSLTPGYVNLLCSVERISGDYSNDLELMIESIDGEIIYRETLSFTFEQEAEDVSFVTNLTSNLAIVGVLIGVVIAIVVLLITRSRGQDDEEEMKSVQLNKIEEDRGGTSQAGPPIISQENQQQGQLQSVEVKSLANEDEVPKLPSSGLPDGWTMEQWKWYGKQYLEQLEQQD